ncbi:MAG: hypothetical protein MJH11_13090 [Lentisphaeria bacterium]|nr:hypothetical protein [Lentisphaeria bacterium]
MADLKPAQQRKVTIDVFDAKGNKVFTKLLISSDYGIASADFVLADQVNMGRYKISAKINDTVSEKNIDVKTYVLPKFKISLDTDRTYYTPGDTVVIDLNARYTFGKPVIGAKVTIRAKEYFAKNSIPQLFGTTDEEGNCKFEFKLEHKLTTNSVNGNAVISLDATVIDKADNQLMKAKKITVSSSSLIINAVAESGKLVKGVENKIYIVTSTPDGRPAVCQLLINGSDTAIKTSKSGVAVYNYTPGNNSIKIRAISENGDMETVSRQLSLDIRANTLLLRPDKAIYTTGESLKLKILSPVTQKRVFVDVIRNNRVLLMGGIDMTNGNGELVLDLDNSCFGTLQVHAYYMNNLSEIIGDTRLIQVNRSSDLKVTAVLDKDTYRPGEKAVINFLVENSQGSPEQAALSLAVVDEAVFALSDMRPGFDQIYFALQSELLKPRYKIPGQTIEEALTSENSQLKNNKMADANAVLYSNVSDGSNIVGSTTGLTFEKRNVLYAKKQEKRREFLSKALPYAIFFIAVLLMIPVILFFANRLWKFHPVQESDSILSDDAQSKLSHLSWVWTIGIYSSCFILIFTANSFPADLIFVSLCCGLYMMAIYLVTQALRDCPYLEKYKVVRRILSCTYGVYFITLAAMISSIFLVQKTDALHMEFILKIVFTAFVIFTIAGAFLAASLKSILPGATRDKVIIAFFYQICATLCPLIFLSKFLRSKTDREVMANIDEWKNINELGEQELYFSSRRLRTMIILFQAIFIVATIQAIIMPKPEINGTLQYFSFLIIVILNIGFMMEAHSLYFSKASAFIETIKRTSVALSFSFLCASLLTVVAFLAIINSEGMTRLAWICVEFLAVIINYINLATVLNLTSNPKVNISHKYNWIHPVPITCLIAIFAVMPLGLQIHNKNKMADYSGANKSPDYSVKMAKRLHVQAKRKRGGMRGWGTADPKASANLEPPAIVEHEMMKEEAIVDNMEVLAFSESPSDEVGMGAALEDIKDEAPQSDDNMDTDEYLNVSPALSDVFGSPSKKSLDASKYFAELKSRKGDSEKNLKAGKLGWPRKATLNYKRFIAPKRIRRFFPETMFWNPQLITDENGKVKLELDLADSITTWRMSMNAISKNGNLGSSDTGIRVFQDFFVNIDFPTHLTQNDKVSIPVSIFNYLKTEQIVKLVLEKSSWYLLNGSNTKMLTLKPGEVRAAYFTITAIKPGRHGLLLNAFGTEMSDAVVRKVDVKPDGNEYITTINGELSGNLTKEIVFPENAIAGGSDLYLKIYPGRFSQVMEGLDGIFRMPGGCFEQTTSSAYPNVLVLNYLRKQKLVKPEVEVKALKYINTGYQRLLTFEVPGGGFDWYGKAPAKTTLTAYGLMQFSDMSKVHNVDPKIITRARKWLFSQQKSDGTWKPTRSPSHQIGKSILKTTAYITWSLGEAGIEKGKLYKSLHYINRQSRNETDAYTLALCANALLANGRMNDAAKLLKKLDKIKSSNGKLVWWSSRGQGVTYSRGDTLSIETTALIAYAMLKSTVDTSNAFKALSWLITQKDSHGTWRSTQATIHAFRALLAADGVHGTVPDDLNPFKIIISANNKFVKRIQISNDNKDVYWLISLREQMKLGKNKISLQTTAKGALTYQIVGKHYLPYADRIRRTDKLLDMKLSYRSRELNKDELLDCHVRLQYNGPGIANMTLVDLGIPPGFEVQREAFERMRSRRLIEKYSIRGNHIIIYLRKIQKGRPLNFTYQMKAKFPLKAKTPVSVAYQYYEPSIRSETSPVTLVVK